MHPLLSGAIFAGPTHAALARPPSPRAEAAARDVAMLLGLRRRLQEVLARLLARPTAEAPEGEDPEARRLAACGRAAQWSGRTGPGPLRLPSRSPTADAEPPSHSLRAHGGHVLHPGGGGAQPLRPHLFRLRSCGRARHV